MNAHDEAAGPPALVAFGIVDRAGHKLPAFARQLSCRFPGGGPIQEVLALGKSIKAHMALRKHVHRWSHRPSARLAIVTNKQGAHWRGARPTGRP